MLTWMWSKKEAQKELSKLQPPAFAAHMSGGEEVKYPDRLGSVPVGLLKSSLHGEKLHGA